MSVSSSCVHCGLCVPHCPTYEVLREEPDSPRGRIYLLEALADGRATAADVRPHLDRCIGCLTCESVCPSGVPYGALLEEGRARLGGPSWPWRLALRHAFQRPWLLAVAAAGARAAGRAPPRDAAPPWPDRPVRPRGRVALHVGCVTPHLFPRLAAETAHVLAALGFAVEVPSDQTCCGALQRHAGMRSAALEERNARAFEGYDLVVSAAAGCSTSAGLTDICRVLLDEGLPPGVAVAPVRVAYDAPCHLLHAQRIDASPLLAGIEGVTLRPLARADACCGAGGLYMERERGLARAVRATKLDAIEDADVDVVATPNPGCLLWLWRGLRERGSRVRLAHPVSLIAAGLPILRGDG